MATKKADNNKFPPQIKFIVGNEAAERFSFYGMRAILTVFMTKYLLMAEGDAVGAYHNFASAVYFTPLLGAFISDRLWGKYKTIMTLSVVYCLGHLVLAMFESKSGLYAGLGLIALGSGGIKPCVSAHVGDQFKSGQEHLLAKVFNLFYWMINFGGFFATIMTPWTLKHYGPSLAFGIPGILMAIATLVFWMGRKHYIHVPPTGPNPHSFVNIAKDGIVGLLSGKGYRAAAKKKHPEKEVEGSMAVFKLLMIYFWISLFWGLYDQSGSTWVLQGEKMNPNFLGMQLDPSQLQAINPIMIMVLIPFFMYVVYPTLEKIGLKLTPLKKMSIGMFITALAFAASATLQGWIEAGQNLSIGYQVFPYMIMACAEVMVSITGLEFAYTQAPRSMKSTIMSLWLLTVTFGNLFVSFLTHLHLAPTASATYFWQFTFMMIGMSIMFSFFCIFYKDQNHMENGKFTPPIME